MNRLKSILRNLRLLLTREITDQIGEVEARLNRRADDYERALDQRLDQRFAATETRLDQRVGLHETTLDQRLDERLADTERRIDQHLDQRSQAADKHLDNRFDILEQRTDERLERHERKVDKMVRQMSNDIVDRTDVMLQLFEQRLDKQRRELRALREHGTPPATQTAANEDSAEEEPGAARDAQQQLRSFRKLANITTHAQTKIKQTGELALYNQILEWKKVAHEGLDQFSPDEREVVDYVLSFLNDPKELHYVNQHMRRFVATLQRIPPAARSTDRLLELGSLSHIAPAIKKYCGYHEVSCADFWTSDETICQETVTQKHVADGGAPESHHFELRNFNVERDAFPYPDGHFQTVICCELIEHLQSDPMHMLWECNRVLAEDGWLLLTTPNIASARGIEGLLVGCAPYLLAQYNVRERADQHNREYAPYEVGVALAAAGFTVVELETEDVWTRSNPAILDLLKQVHISTELRGDNIFALARKTSAPVERYPQELYID